MALSVINPVVSISLLVWTLYLVAIWSEKWNKQFESTTNDSQSFT